LNRHTFDEAEKLSRNVVRIVKKLRGPACIEMQFVFGSLVNVILLKRDFSDEAKHLLEEYLGEALTYEGGDSEIT
jgi:hypothetical protein